NQREHGRDLQLGRQSAKCLLDLLSRFPLEEMVGLRRPGGFCEQILFGTSSAEMVKGGVRGDPPRPGSEISVGPKMLARPVNAPERLHRQVLRYARVAHDAHNPGIDIALELPGQRLECIDLAKRKSLQQIHGLLYCLLRARNERVTSVLGASPKNRQNHRRSRSCWAAASCRGNVFPWEPAGQVYPGFRYCACWNEVLGLLANKKRICPEHRMSLSQSLARRSPASLETVQGILRDLVARHCQDDVLTSVRQIPAREAKFRPIPRWVASALSEAYRAKAIQELYSHQAATSELVHDGKNVVVVTP